MQSHRQWSAVDVSESAESLLWKKAFSVGAAQESAQRLPLTFQLLQILLRLLPLALPVAAACKLENFVC